MTQLPVTASFTLPRTPPPPPPLARVASKPACTLDGACISSGSWPSRGAGSAKLNSPLPSGAGPESQRASGLIGESACPKNEYAYCAYSPSSSTSSGAEGAEVLERGQPLHLVHGVAGD